MFKEFLLQNWETILITLAFVVLLKTTIFLDKKLIRRMYWLILMVFILSIITFLEYYYNINGMFKEVRNVLIAIRYSATPLIIAMIIFTLVKKSRWYVFIPALLVALLNLVSIYTGIIYRLNENGALIRGPLGYLPFIAVGAYSALLIYILIKQSNKLLTEIIPIAFLCFAFVSGLILPFIFKQDYSQLFCSTIIVALFVYYVFSILQLTKKDSLTGLLNRQAYYVTEKNNPKDVTGIISIDMNGLKTINDTYGHQAGDEALTTISLCIIKATKIKQPAYRVGGDEFIIVCWRSTEEEIKELIKKIENNVSESKYSCSIGYSYSGFGMKSIDEMVKESDVMMYENKAKYYEENELKRR